MFSHLMLFGSNRLIEVVYRSTTVVFLFYIFHVFIYIIMSLNNVWEAR